jgi:tetratricopeptide (TPR) repeat protein
LFGLRKQLEAIGYFDKTINLDANSCEAYNKKGIVLNSLNRFKEALDCFDCAIRIAPNVLSFHYKRRIAIQNINSN